MFLNFFFDLKQAQLPVSLKEYLMLMDAMDKRVISSFDVNDFYFLSRSALIKDERHLDKFDKVLDTPLKVLKINQKLQKLRFLKSGLSLWVKNTYQMKKKNWLSLLEDGTN